MPLLFALVVAFGMLVGAKFSHSSSREVLSPSSKINEVLNVITSSYVDTPNNKKLTESAITAMLKDLDPHSTYIPAEDLKVANEDLEGNFEGVGIEFNILHDTIIVVSPISGGPSESVGVRAGDRIIKIDGKTVAGVGFTNEDVFTTLRGKKGTKVKLTIDRMSEKSPLEFTITRDKIPIYSLDASYMATDEIAYIKINRFSATTLSEFNDAMSKLRRNGMKHMILDLRGNPGGYLKAAIQLADEFLSTGKMIVYTQGRQRKKEVYKSSGVGGFERGKLVVLIDEGSASASEIVSGALQDLDRAIIIGRRSFGKGLVQEPFMLKDGSALRLTVARYYTPSGRSIQRPYDNGVEDYYGEITHRFEDGEMVSKDSIRLADSLKYYTSNGRLVYGGGGIMPDIFVPLDTSNNTEYLKRLISKGIFNDFILNYMDKNRTSLHKKYSDYETFHKNFNKDGSLLKEFQAFATANGVGRNIRGYGQSESFVRNQLKALIARQLFNNEAFYRVVNENNNVIQKGISIIQSDMFDKLKIEYR